MADLGTLPQVSVGLPHYWGGVTRPPSRWRTSELFPRLVLAYPTTGAGLHDPLTMADLGTLPQVSVGLPHYWGGVTRPPSRWRTSELFPRLVLAYPTTGAGLHDPLTMADLGTLPQVSVGLPHYWGGVIRPPSRWRTSELFPRLVLAYPTTGAGLHDPPHDGGPRNSSPG